MGIENSNPILDIQFYELEILYGTTEAIIANIISYNML